MTPASVDEDTTTASLNVASLPHPPTAASGRGGEGVNRYPLFPFLSQALVPSLNSPNPHLLLFMSPQKTKLKCKKSGCRRQTDLETTVFRTAKLFCSANYYCSSDYGYYVTDTLRPEAFFQTPTPPQEHQEKPKTKNQKKIQEDFTRGN